MPDNFLDSMMGFGTFVSDLATPVLNWMGIQTTNQRNEALMRESWARDDNAIQRKVADLAAAGLNPVLAAGGSGSPNSGAISLRAPGTQPLDFSNVYAAQIARQQRRQGEANASAAESTASIAKINEDILQKQSTFLSDKMPGGGSPLVYAPVLQSVANAEEAISIAQRAQYEAMQAKANAEITERNNRLSEKYQEGQIIAGLVSTGLGSALDVVRGGNILTPKYRLEYKPK